MKSLHDGMKQMTNVLKQTHLKDAHIVLLTNFSRTVLVWCGFVLYLSGRYLCGVGLFRTIVNGSTHCVLFFCTRLDLFRTIETFFVPESDSILRFVDGKW